MPESARLSSNLSPMRHWSFLVLLLPHNSQTPAAYLGFPEPWADGNWISAWWLWWWASLAAASTREPSPFFEGTQFFTPKSWEAKHAKKTLGGGWFFFVQPKVRNFGFMTVISHAWTTPVCMVLYSITHLTAHFINPILIKRFNSIDLGKHLTTYSTVHIIPLIYSRLIYIHIYIYTYIHIFISYHTFSKVWVVKCITEVLEEPPFSNSEGCLLLASLATNEMTIHHSYQITPISSELKNNKIILSWKQNNISNCPLAIECWLLEDVAKQMHELPPWSQRSLTPQNAANANASTESESTDWWSTTDQEGFVRSVKPWKHPRSTLCMATSQDAIFTLNVELRAVLIFRGALTQTYNETARIAS